MNGRVVKIEPNSANPIGVANIYNDFINLKATGGRMYPKGNAAIMALYDADRVKTPLRRKAGTARGAGQWDVISDDAPTSAGDWRRMGQYEYSRGPGAFPDATPSSNFLNAALSRDNPRPRPVDPEAIMLL